MISAHGASAGDIVAGTRPEKGLIAMTCGYYKKSYFGIKVISGLVWEGSNVVCSINGEETEFPVYGKRIGDVMMLYIIYQDHKILLNKRYL